MSRHTLKEHRRIDDLLHDITVFIFIFQIRRHFQRIRDRDPQIIRDHLTDTVAVRIRHIESTGDILDAGLCRQRSEGDDLRDAVLAVFSRDIIDHFLTSFITEIDVEVRHADTFVIEETLEDQAVLDRIDIRDLKRISNKRSCTGTTSRSDHDVILFCIVDKVPYDQIVIGIPHRGDDRHLILGTLPVFRYLFFIRAP